MSVPASAGEPSPLRAALVIIVCGWALTLATYWPGWMSFDAADQYLQVLNGRFTDVHPPLMAALWTWTNRVVPGPGGIFALHALAFWIGLVATLAVRLGGWRLALAAFAIGLWPPVALMLGHVWKDVGTAAALLIATAAALHWRRRGGWPLWLIAVAALMIAAAYRHNAITACLPLLALLLWREGDDHWRAIALRSLLATVALLAAPTLVLRATGAEHKLAWPAVAIFDIAAVSVATGEQRVPPEISAPSLTVDDLRAHFTPWANPSIFETGKIKLSFFVHYGPTERNAVAGAWLRLLTQRPEEWLAHRLRLSKYLLLGPPAEAPRELVVVPRMLLPPAAGLSLTPPDNALLRWQLEFADRWWRTPVFWAAPYLALTLLVMLVVRRHPRRWQPAWILCLSALAYALPLALISGAAEARYLLWSEVIALAAAAMVFIPPDRHPPPA
jgi:hypothetical protein